MNKLFFCESKIIDTSKKEYLKEALNYIKETLGKNGISDKLIIKTELLAEEVIVSFVAHSTDNKLTITTKHMLGETAVSLSMSGEEFELFNEDTMVFDDNDEISGEAVRSILLKSYGDNFKYHNKKSVNNVRIITENTQKSLHITILALFLGILIGFAAKLLFPQQLTDIMTTYCLTPVKTMFMNAIKIIIAPVVFFSIVACISQFSDISELGKLGTKVMGIYLLTTVLAVLLSFTIANYITPGEFGFVLSEQEDVAKVEIAATESSLLSTIVNIVPSNFFKPFIESDTLQLIFLAVLCGIALGMIGDYSTTLKELFDALNSLFLKITSLITRLIPVAVFCSIALMVINMEAKTLLSIVSYTLQQILAVLCMMLIYGLLILVLGRLNPLKFYTKAKEGMLTSFTLSSSSAAMPTNLKVCTNKLGISPKVCNFSIPLGTTINMDGTCIYLTIAVMFLARAYGINISISQMETLFVTIVLLSLGAPGVPGSAIVCLGIVLKTVNVPVEAIGLIIPVYPLMDMFDTMSNTTGDIAAALIVAKKENLLDLDMYNS
ncbi:MAG: dicarboxylate/amino acid:cation symporter [Lachnospiraceae bacterium]|nr:dicarboxylate/amino acid:cation symporter [Lachnospiraceae bacterium]